MKKTIGMLSDMEKTVRSIAKTDLPNDHYHKCIKRGAIYLMDLLPDDLLDTLMYQTQWASGSTLWANSATSYTVYDNGRVVKNYG